jgi:hypothetical protein
MGFSVSKARNKGGRPRTDATPVMVRVPPAILLALDAFVANTERRDSRPGTIRFILEEWLGSQGYFKPPRGLA